MKDKTPHSVLCSVRKRSNQEYIRRWRLFPCHAENVKISQSGPAVITVYPLFPPVCSRTVARCPQSSSNWWRGISSSHYPKLSQFMALTHPPSPPPMPPPLPLSDSVHKYPRGSSVNATDLSSLAGFFFVALECASNLLIWFSGDLTAVGCTEAAYRAEKQRIIAHRIKESQSETEEEQPGGAGSDRVDSFSPPCTLWIIKLQKGQNSCDGYKEGCAEEQQRGRDGSEHPPSVLKRVWVNLWIVSED